MKPDELYIGIDLGERFSQICSVSGADRVSLKAVENAATPKGSYLFPNPVPLSRILTDGKCNDAGQLAALLGSLLSALKEKKAVSCPAGVGVCLHDFTREAAEAVRTALARCGVPAEKTAVFSREEAFAIRYHMGFSGNEDKGSVGKVFEQFPLAFALSVADMEATYFLEGK